MAQNYPKPRQNATGLRQAVTVGQPGTLVAANSPAACGFPEKWDGPPRHDTPYIFPPLMC